MSVMTVASSFWSGIHEHRGNDLGVYKGVGSGPSMGLPFVH